MASEIICGQQRTVADVKRSQGERLRSVPDRQPYVRALLLCTIHYMGIIATLTTIAAFVIAPSRLATLVLIVCLGFTAATWLLAYFKRRVTHCPLCKGTPLLSSGALPHKNATRIFPFNHGVTATLSIIATQKFRCMYCGTGFDILKPPSHKRGGERAANAEGHTADSTDYQP